MKDEMSDQATDGGYTLAELCISAAAEAWRGEGEILASGIGVIPRLAAGLAWLSFSPDPMMTDSEVMLVSEPVPVGPRRVYQPKIEGTDEGGEPTYLQGTFISTWRRGHDNTWKIIFMLLSSMRD